MVLMRGRKAPDPRLPCDAALRPVLPPDALDDEVEARLSRSAVSLGSNASEGSERVS